MTLALAQTQPPPPSDAACIAASLEAPSRFSAVFERHHPAVHRYLARRLGYAELLDLPREPQALYRRLRAAAVDCECGNGVDEETFVIAGDLLRDNPIPANLRAAILRAAALIPGIELVDRQRDVAGRAGVGVAFDGTGSRSVLIFDPKTYALLGENDGGGGSADIESAIVDSLSARP